MYEYRAVVLRVVDGDTIDVDIDLGFDIWVRDQRLRLYSVDTPETRTRDDLEKKYGNIAKDKVKAMCPEGSTVTVITMKDEKGKFGRMLAEVWTEEGICINDYLIENKYAVLYYGQSKKAIFEEHQANYRYHEGLINENSNNI